RAPGGARRRRGTGPTRRRASALRRAWPRGRPGGTPRTTGNASRRRPRRRGVDDPSTSPLRAGARPRARARRGPERHELGVAVERHVVAVAGDVAQALLPVLELVAGRVELDDDLAPVRAPALLGHVDERAEEVGVVLEDEVVQEHAHPDAEEVVDALQRAP